MQIPKRLDELLEDKGGSYILPFFWMHGEGIEILGEELEKIRECGIKEICLESRPHPDFAGDIWWQELDFIMEEARKSDMKVWVLDDVNFPTGYANGGFVKKPELAKIYLAERHMDVIGPIKDSAVLIEPFLGSDGELLAVIACPKPDTQSLNVSGEGILDLTNKVTDGVVYFDIPEGYYRIFILFTTRKNGGRENYMNLIDSDSVRVLIDEVYEPHYARYSKDFGKTFAGFFSDEPEFGNTPGYDFQDKLGKRDVKLPWSQQLHDALKDKMGQELVKNLPALWYDMGEKTPSIRSNYMDSITKLVDTCFTSQIGDWCRERGAQYIGHIIEDDNAHGRLGCSIGHYFRAQKGQDMSGIDVVLLQIMPGFTETYHQWIASDRDGEFFHYGLAKMGSSYAHIDPDKKGRALCEIFGAYGWAEGVSLMKWLTDHMLVRGINNFVPHAFTPQFPDRDCPPHFYARGNNPQYRFFALLMKYMNRLSHLLNGGKSTADTAVLYHADAEWSGGKTMLFQEPVRQILEHQLDCDIIPADMLTTKDVTIEDGKMVINEIDYGSFVIPYCEFIPQEVVEFSVMASKKGLKIYMIDQLPAYNTQGEPLASGFIEAVTLIPLKELGKEIKNNQDILFDIPKHYKDLRASCYKHEDSHVWMFFNESVFETVDTQVKLPSNLKNIILKYDGLSNTYEEVLLEGNKLSLLLEPGEAAVYIRSTIDKGNQVETKSKAKKEVTLRPLDIDWEVSTATALEYPVFEYKTTLKAGEKLPNMNAGNMFPRFTGTFRYKGEFELADKENSEYVLDFPKIGDCAEIYVNGKYIEMLIGNPYRVTVTDYLQKGQNTLVIEVTNTLVWQIHDGQSTHMQLNPTGMTAVPVLHIQ